MSDDVIYTIGHSTRPLDEFIALLNAHGVTRLADIRTVPRSRRHPHFSQDELSRSLPAAGVEYRHFAALGGLRKPRADSSNTAWRHPGFRGYADYMETPAFAAALEELLIFAKPASLLAAPQIRERALGGSPLRVGNRADEAPSRFDRTAVMCAEALFWRCHRQLLADALVARGVEVRHITSASAAPAHTLTDFAQIDGKRAVYRRLI